MKELRTYELKTAQREDTWNSVNDNPENLYELVEQRKQDYFHAAQYLRQVFCMNFTLLE